MQAEDRGATPSAGEAPTGAAVVGGTLGALVGLTSLGPLAGAAVTPGAVILAEKAMGELRGRWVKRGAEVLDAVSAATGADELQRRLAESPEVDALLMRAVLAASATGLQDKRRLLGRLIRDAVLDDAEIDEASVLIAILERVDGPHIRCLEGTHRAEQETESAGELAVALPTSEKAHNQRVQDECERYPSPVVQQLIAMGLLDGEVTWGGAMWMKGPTALGVQLLEFLREGQDSDVA